MDDDEFDIFSKELDEEWDEIEKAFVHMDSLFDWLPVLGGLVEIIDTFNAHMLSLSLPHELIRNSKYDASFFLLGTLWSASLSAYEGFIHDLFHLILQNENFYSLAKENIEKLQKYGKNIIDIKKNNCDSISKELVEKFFREATLHNPCKVEKIMKNIFHLDIPTLDSVKIDHSLKIRNAFTHNNGMIDGTRINITLDELIVFHKEVEELVTLFGERVINEADSDVDKANLALA